MGNVNNKAPAVTEVKTIMAHYSSTEDPRLSLSQTDIQNGLIKDMGQRGALVYIVLASYMNRQAVSYPSQSQVAELIGMAVTTVRKALDELVAGGYINELTKGGKKFYRLTNASTGAYVMLEDEDEQAELEEKLLPKVIFTSSKDVATYFAKVYEDVFNVPYTINYARDYSLIKQKLMGTYSNIQIQTAIDVGIRYYVEEWSNPNFPRPTISILATWLVNEALTFDQVGAEDEDKLADKMAMAEQDDMSDLAGDLFS